MAAVRDPRTGHRSASHPSTILTQPDDDQPSQGGLYVSGHTHNFSVSSMCYLT